MTFRPAARLHSAENLLGDKLADLAALEPDDQAAMLKVLDALVMKHNKLQAPYRRSQLTVPQPSAGRRSRPSIGARDGRAAPGWVTERHILLRDVRSHGQESRTVQSPPRRGRLEPT